MWQTSRNVIFRRSYFTCPVRQRPFIPETESNFKKSRKIESKWYKSKSEKSFEKPKKLTNVEVPKELREKEVIKPKDLPPAKLFDDLTPEFVTKLTGEGPRSMTKKFILDHLKSAIQYLEFRKYPLPDNLTEKQWQQFMKYDTKRAITFYMDAIIDGKDEDPEILEELKIINEYPMKPLIVEPEVFQKLVTGKGREEDWQAVCQMYEEIQMNGGDVWPFPKENEVRSLLASAKSRNNLNQCLKYVAETKTKELKEHIGQVSHQRFLQKLVA